MPFDLSRTHTLFMHEIPIQNWWTHDKSKGILNVGSKDHTIKIKDKKFWVILISNTTHSTSASMISRYYIILIRYYYYYYYYIRY
jgi:hypothetical protein